MGYHHPAGTLVLARARQEEGGMSTRRYPRPSDCDQCPDCGGLKRIVAERCRPCRTKLTRQRIAQENRYIHIHKQGREHKRMAEQMIGRPLVRDEVVHHINGKRWDNRPENLQVMTRGDHTRLHNRERYEKLRRAA